MFKIDDFQDIKNLVDSDIDVETVKSIMAISHGIARQSDTEIDTSHHEDSDSSGPGGETLSSFRGDPLD